MSPPAPPPAPLPTSPGTPAATPDPTWLDALPTAALWVGLDGTVGWCNAAAAALGATTGRAWSTLWVDAADAAAALADGAAPCLSDTRGQAWQLRVRAQGAGAAAGWLVTAENAQARHDAESEVMRLNELLDLAREFGRLGLWERDMRTMEGRWDRQVRTFWGLDPDEPTPNFALAIQNIIPADRDTLDAYFRASLEHAGRYAVRFRVRARDGTVRRIHSQWMVKNGPDGRPARQIGLMMDDTEPFALARSASELESQLELAAELAGISVWRHDLATQRMHYSARGWRTLGLRPVAEGLTLEQVRQMIHPADLPRVVASAEAALKSPQPVDVEARYRHASGHWLHQVLRRTVLRDDRGEPIAFIGVAMEASESQVQRRRAEELAQRLELVTGAAGIGYWTWETGQAMPRWSTQLRLLYGLPPDAPEMRFGEWMRRHVHPDDQARVRAALPLPVPEDESRHRVEVTFRALRADGEVRQMYALSIVRPGSDGVTLVGVLIDLTDRLRAEQALVAATEQAALALQAAGMGTWQMDFHTWVAHWDEQMWRLRGREPQPRAMSTEERVACTHPDDRERLADILQQQHEEGLTQEYEFRVILPDGTVRWLASRSTERVDPVSGHRVRSGVNWDVTDRRNAEGARRERELALRESAAKSRFMARMSHELRTPLNAMLGYAQLIPGQRDAARQAEHAQHILAAGRHLLALINDVLDLSGLEGGEVRVADQVVLLAPLVHDVLALVQPQLAARGLRADVDLAPSVPALRADTTRLRQVLLNLLSNAIKYNREGGRVRVSTRRERGPERRVVLAVADDGPGLSPAQQRQLFEPFNRLGAEQGGVEGTGIGLAIVKALVARMGGEVRVRSRLGEGSVFEVRLPAAETAAAPATGPARPPPALPTAAPPAAPAASAHRVLYVEDNPVNAQIVAELVALRGDIALRVAPTGTEGLRLAREWAPALLLLDMQLPDMDGCGFMAQLRATPHGAALPCVALSANAMPDDIARALAAGVAAYWTKPLDFTAFLAELAQRFGPAPPRDPGRAAG